jgi:hypothetical protein
MNETAGEATNQPYIVVSMADHKLWHKQGKEVLFEAPVATGSGKGWLADRPGSGASRRRVPR